MKQLLLVIFMGISIFAEAQISEYHLSNTDLNPEDAFGHSVSVSNNYVAVGTPGLENNKGGVLIYKGMGSSWDLHSTLIHSSALEGDYGGLDVAMNETIMVAGAPTDPWSGDETGRAFVYELENNQWIEKATLLPSSTFYNSAFGYVVNIHKENILIGAPDYGQSRGAVVWYKKTNNVWSLMQEIINPDFWLSSFGGAVDMNDEWLAAGGYFTDENDISSGNRYTVKIYKRQGDEWIENQVINYEYQSLPFQTPTHSIEFSEDQLLIGNHRPDIEINIDGEMKVFHLSGDQWVEVQQIRPPGFTKAEVGRHVAMTENFALAGASKSSLLPINEPHHIFIFNTEDEDNWQLIGDFSYERSIMLNVQGFNMDICEFHGVAGSSNSTNQHGDVYIYNLKRITDNKNIIEEHVIEVSPIPSNTFITIQTNDTKITAYTIFNSSGQVMLKANITPSIKEEVNISSLPTGSFWLKLETTSGKLYKKIVKI